MNSDYQRKDSGLGSGFSQYIGVQTDANKSISEYSGNGEENITDTVSICSRKSTCSKSSSTSVSTGVTQQSSISEIEESSDGEENITESEDSNRSRKSIYFKSSSTFVSTNSSNNGSGSTKQLLKKPFKNASSGTKVNIVPESHQAINFIKKKGGNTSAYRNMPRALLKEIKVARLTAPIH